MRREGLNVRIKIEFQGPGFVAVPNHVAAMVGQVIGDLVPQFDRDQRKVSDDTAAERFTASDLGALVVFAMLPVGSEWSARWAQDRLGIGRDAWQAIARRLRAVGAMWDDTLTGEDGRHRGRCLAVRWPELAAGAKARKRGTKGGAAGGWKHRKPGKPNDGKPGSVGPGKPNDGKPGIRSSQVIEIVGETVGEVCENPVAPKTKTDGDDAAPLGVAASSPSNFEMTSEGEVNFPALSEFQRSRIRDGLTVIVDEVCIHAGSAASERHRLAYRSWQAAQEAVNGR